MTTGAALKMRWELQALMQRHRIEPASPVTIPFSPPTDGPVTVMGLAATTDLDLQRTRLRKFCFDNLYLHLKGYPLPPLLWKHRPGEIAAEIRALAYSDQGNLEITADVSHALARRAPAFSASFVVHDFEIKNADTPEFFSLVTRATLDEISMTDMPANLHSVVQYRHATAPVAPYLDTLHATDALLIQGLGKCVELVGMLREINARPAEIETDLEFLPLGEKSKKQTTGIPRPTPKLRQVEMPVVAHRQSEFGRFIDAMEEHCAS